MANSDQSPPIDCTSIATEWLARLDSTARSGRVDDFSTLFLPTGWMRDLLCFGWEFRSLAGRENIVAYLSDPISDDGQNVSRFVYGAFSNPALEVTSSLGPPSTFPIPGAPTGTFGVMATFTFALSNPARTGRGFVRLVPDPAGVVGVDGKPSWKAFTIFLNVEELVGHEEPKERPSGVWDGHSKTWSEVKTEMAQAVEADPTVLVVGGGQAGLMCAARMGRIGIRALIVEKSARVGDVWRKRYPNLSLHTSAHHCSILYHPWPKTYPKFIPKDIVADFLEAYAIGQNLVVWLSSTILPQPAPVFDEDTGRWTVTVQRTYRTVLSGEPKVETVTLHPRHIVMATGNGRARIPKWEGMDSFKGTMYHSDQHQDTKKWAGKKAVVVGACNAAADVAQSFLSPHHAAASVTMIQRSATCVISSRTADAAVFSTAFSESRTIEDADFANHSMPHRLALRLSAGGGTARLKKMDEALLKGLVECGFKLTWELEPGGGEVGLLGFFFEKTSSGTMLDFGCGQSIIDGKIKVKSGVEIDHFDTDGLVLSDGSRLDADVAVLATGNEPIIANAIDLLGPGIKDKIGDKIWGLDPEGELTRCYRPTGQRGLWFTPGAFQHSRFFSKHLAIQILAEELGLKK